MQNLSPLRFAASVPVQDTFLAGLGPSGNGNEHSPTLQELPAFSIQTAQMTSVLILST